MKKKKKPIVAKWDSLKQDVEPGDMAGHCKSCGRDTYFREFRPRGGPYRCIRCWAKWV